MPTKSTISVILSTYRQPVWLEKVLVGYNQQTFTDFELVVADDGSGAETKAVIDEARVRLALPIKHVWHEDDGFRKTIILNKAIRASTGSYLVFSDGDCIPREDFLAKHAALRQAGRFLSGGYFKLPADISTAITQQDIVSQRCFTVDWLRQQGWSGSLKDHKLTASGLKERLLNRLTPTSPTWNGMNSSGWREDILAVNGFDERMQYGGEDREMGERLTNKGIVGRQIRYSAICLHLWHERGYVRQEMIDKNEAIRAETRRAKRVRSEYGLDRDLQSR